MSTSGPNPGGGARRRHAGSSATPLYVVAGLLAVMIVFAFGYLVGRQPGATNSPPQQSAAETVVPQQVSEPPPPASPRPAVVAATAAPAVRPHALLVRRGMRFQSVASERLALHGPATVEMWLKVVEPADGLTEVRLNNFSFWLRGQGVTFLAQSAHTVGWPELGVGVWRYLAATFDGAQLRLYVDGVEVANGRASLAGNSLGVQASVQIAHTNPPGPVVAIDELRVFSRPRAQEQIRSDMHTAVPVDDPGLLGAWTFDEGQGQEVRDAGRYGLNAWLGTDPTRPDAADAVWIADTPSNPAPIPPERVTRSRPPCRGGNCALAFVDRDQVTTPGLETLTAELTTTVEAWVKVETPPPSALEIVHFNNRSVAFRVYVNRQRVSCVAGWEGLNAPDALRLDASWHHVACTYDGQTQRLFVDGALVASRSATLKADYIMRGRSHGSVTIGLARDGGGVVLIDEARVWARARTAEEVAAGMKTAVAGGEPGLLGAWGFDEVDGKQVLDRSPLAHHGWLGSSPAQPTDADPERVQEAAPLRGSAPGASVSRTP